MTTQRSALRLIAPQGWSRAKCGAMGPWPQVSNDLRQRLMCVREAREDSGAPVLDEQRQRLLDQVGERAEELGSPRAVECPVVAGERQHHRRLDSRLTVERDDAIGDAADGENRRLRRVD